MSEIIYPIYGKIYGEFETTSYIKITEKYYKSILIDGNEYSIYKAQRAKENHIPTMQRIKKEEFEKIQRKVMKIIDSFGIDE